MVKLLKSMTSVEMEWNVAKNEENGEERKDGKQSKDGKERQEDKMNDAEDRKDEEKHQKDEKKKESLENESYINVAIVKCQDGDQYLFIRQCANMLNITNDNTISIFCGALSIKLNNDPGRKRRHLYDRKRSHTGRLRTVFSP